MLKHRFECERHGIVYAYEIPAGKEWHGAPTTCPVETSCDVLCGAALTETVFEREAYTLHDWQRAYLRTWLTQGAGMSEAEAKDVVDITARLLAVSVPAVAIDGEALALSMRDGLGPS